MSVGLGGLGGPKPQNDVVQQPTSQQLQPHIGSNNGRQYVGLPPRTVLPRLAPNLLGQQRPQVRNRSVREQIGAGNMQLRNEAIFAGVPGRAEFESRAGRPKDDIKFAFCTFKMSTGYKNILSKIEDFQQEIATPIFVSTRRELTHLNEHLSLLKKATDNYAGKNSHTRKAEVLKLANSVLQDQSVVTDLLSQVNSGAKLPEGMTLSEVMDYARAGITLKDMGSFRSRGIEPKLARAMVEVDVPLQELKSYLNAGVTPQEAKKFYDAGVSPQTAGIYSAHHLSFTPDSQIKYEQSDVIGTPKKLGNGAFNTVFETKYNDGTTQVFKPLRAPYPNREHRIEHGWVADESGIDLYDPQMAMRNIATGSIANELGFDVVAKTQLAIQKSPKFGSKNVSPSNWESQLGLVMEKAPGLEGKKTPSATFNDPKVRKELTKLQLLDALTGQGDRHPGNYFIDKQLDGTVKITGIDNDQCFGKNITDANGIKQGNRESNHGFRGCSLPEVIDTDMAKSIEDLTPERLEELLGDKLSPEEVIATKQRLAGMKAHVQKLRSKGRIIAPDKWGDPAVVKKNNSGTSYVVRDQKYRLRKEREQQQINVPNGQNDNINNVLNNLGMF